jgi:hypothetical protein
MRLAKLTARQMADFDQRREDHALAISLMHAVNRSAMMVSHRVYPTTMREFITRIHGYLGGVQQRSLAQLIVVALQNSEFIVPGKPPRTGWQGLSRPIRGDNL